MTKATQTPAVTVDATVAPVVDATVAPVVDATVAVAPAAPAAPAAPKAPSKKSLAVDIFKAKLALRLAGTLATNKDFRAAVLAEIQTTLGVSVASAATMYNSAKQDAEAAGTIVLGRDPKKEKAPATGKRGRPAGSKNKAADDTASTTVVVNVPEAAAEPAVAQAAAEPAVA